MSEKRAAEMIGQLSKQNEKLKEEKQELLEALKEANNYIQTGIANDYICQYYLCPPEIIEDTLQKYEEDKNA